MRLLPSITTLSNPISSWEKQIQELAPLQITQAALFLTGLATSAERKTCYASLESLQKQYAFSLPAVHARSEMEADEYRYLMHQFGTERFNLHPRRDYPIPALPADLHPHIYIENIPTLHAKDLEQFAGICLDLSHLEDCRRLQESAYNEILELVRHHPIGMNHISAVPETEHTYKGHVAYSLHTMTDLSEFDYLTEYPAHFLSNFSAIELYNPLKEQLEVKAYIETLFT